jgi:hypothetical protein
LAELHQKYGHVVRVNHDELSFTDPDSWKDVCTPSHPLFTEYLATDLACLHTEIEDYDLKISRKMLTTPQIYGHGTKGTAGSAPNKHWLRYGRTMNGEPNLIQARDVDHSRQRKIFTPAFSDRALKQQEPLFLKYTDQLVSKLKESIKQDPDAKLDMVRMYNFTTFDIMGDLTFGEPLHMLKNAE